VAAVGALDGFGADGVTTTRAWLHGYGLVGTGGQAGCAGFFLVVAEDGGFAAVGAFGALADDFGAGFAAAFKFGQIEFNGLPTVLAKTFLGHGTDSFRVCGSGFADDVQDFSGRNIQILAVLIAGRRRAPRKPVAKNWR
jgi:hypothetical protein